jgi:hypothetical protein
MNELEPPLLERLDIPDRCRLCIALARVAAIDAKLARNVDELAKDTLDGPMFDNLAKGLAEQLSITLDEAKKHIDEQRSEVIDKAMQAVARLNGMRAQQAKIGERIVRHCETGVMRFVPVSGEGDIAVELCGSTTRESVQGLGDAEIARVLRD